MIDTIANRVKLLYEAIVKSLYFIFMESRVT